MKVTQRGALPSWPKTYGSCVSCLGKPTALWAIMHPGVPRGVYCYPALASASAWQSCMR